MTISDHRRLQIIADNQLTDAIKECRSIADELDAAAKSVETICDALHVIGFNLEVLRRA